MEHRMRRHGMLLALAALALVVTDAWLGTALAHGIGGKDAEFVANTNGPDILPFMYLGAKHMVTGYDHLLFILGVIFFLYRMRDVAIYVTLFSLGHSITLLAGVLMEINVNPYIVDAIIGLSVVYKAFDNLGGFKSVFGVQPNNKVAVGAFGLGRGFGEHVVLQYRRRARAADRADVHARGHRAVAQNAELRALCGRRQCRDHDRRLRSHAVSDRWLFLRRRSGSLDE
jgi:hypothetical protein